MTQVLTATATFAALLTATATDNPHVMCALLVGCMLAAGVYVWVRRVQPALTTGRYRPAPVRYAPHAISGSGPIACEEVVMRPTANVRRTK